MPKKTKPYGTQSLTAPSYKVTYLRNNGTINGPFYGAPLSPYNRRIGGSSTIVDQTGNDGRFRPVTHVSELYSVVPLGSVAATQVAVYPFSASPTATKMAFAENAFFGVHGLRYFRFTNAIGTITNTFGAVGWNSLAATAMQAMLPSFHTKNSLVNFLLELKDLRSVVKLIGSNFGKKLSRLDTFRVKGPNGTSINTTVNFDRGQPFRVLSRRYLEYNFGWKPLFNDVVSLLETISRFDLRYRELVRDAGKPVQKHWRTLVSGTALNETIPYSDYSGTNSSSWVGDFYNAVKCRVVIDAHPGIQYNATLRMRYQVPPELLAAGGRLKAFLDTLGLARNPAVLWNAIPFSFIVDWVVGVNSYLERLRLDNIQFKTEILDFCHSAKIQTQVKLDLAVNSYNPGSGYFFTDWITTDRCQIKRYERKVGLPDLTLALQTSGLSLREIALSGALAGARRGY